VRSVAQNIRSDTKRSAGPSFGPALHTYSPLDLYPFTSVT